MALEHQRQMIVTPATSRLHSLLVWRFVRWTDRTHLGGRLWAWRVPQIAAIVVAVSAIGLAIAERRARARQAIAAHLDDGRRSLSFRNGGGW
jgi:anti-sigma-K factor RskA